MERPGSSHDAACEQCYVMAFSDTFLLLGGVLVIGLIASLFLKMESCRLAVLTGLP
jgi:hypothetical protein